MFRLWWASILNEGPVVQSIVSLMTSLRVISLTVLADSIYNILILFAEKMWVAFALQKLLTFFSKKIQHICISLNVNFNESLTNDVVSFEQLGPDKAVELDWLPSNRIWIPIKLIHILQKKKKKKKKKKSCLLDCLSDLADEFLTGKGDDM